MTERSKSGTQRLTFELTGARRQDAFARLAKMYRVPPTGPWWHAAEGPLDRRVRLARWWQRARRPAAALAKQCLASAVRAERVDDGDE